MRIVITFYAIYRIFFHRAAASLAVINGAAQPLALIGAIFGAFWHSLWHYLLMKQAAQGRLVRFWQVSSVPDSPIRAGWCSFDLGEQGVDAGV